MGHHLSKEEDHTCPVHNLSENASNTFVGDMSFYRFNMIFSGCCAALASLIVISLLLMHASHLSKPNEQLKIMKIGLLIPFYAAFSLLSICFPTSNVYISPWLDFFQSLALGSFFLLMCEFVSESPLERDVFFAALEIPNKKAPNGKGDGLAWYRTRWIMIFQYPVVATLVAILTDITEAAGIYCDYISKPYFARLWLTLANKASLILAVLSILKFYRALKTNLENHKPLAKLLAFKLVVFFTFVEGILFWILTDVGVLNPTSTLTYADLNIGLPNMIICAIMVPLSVFFHYAYSFQPYVVSGLVFQNDNNLPDQYQGGVLGFKAWFEVWSPVEILKAIAFAFTMASGNFGGVNADVEIRTENGLPQYQDRRPRRQRRRRH